MMMALDFAVGPSHEVVLVGEPDAADTKAMLKALRTRFVPNKVVLFRPSGQAEPEIARLAPFVEGQRAVEGRATAYVCLNAACAPPMTEVGRLLKALGISGLRAKAKKD